MHDDDALQPAAVVNRVRPDTRHERRGVGARGRVVVRLFAMSLALVCSGEGLSRAGGWAPPGIPISPSTFRQDQPQLASDAGGTIFVWRDERSGVQTIYAQELGEDGRELWGPPGGVLVCTSAGNKFGPQVASDGTGGAIVAWLDQRNGPGAADVYAEHLSGATGAPSWTSGSGVLLLPHSAASAQELSLLVNPAAGAGYIVVDGPSNDSTWVVRFRLDSGAVDWERYYASGTSTVAALDPVGGIILAWVDRESGLPLIVADRISPSNVEVWTPHPLLVSATGGAVDWPGIAGDGNGGAYVTWMEGGFPNPTVKIQHLQSDGSQVWGLDGVVASRSPSRALPSPIVFRSETGLPIVVYGMTYPLVYYGTYYANSLQVEEIDDNGFVVWEADVPAKPITALQAVTDRWGGVITITNTSCVRVGSGGGIVWIDPFDVALAYMEPTTAKAVSDSPGSAIATYSGYACPPSGCSIGVIAMKASADRICAGPCFSAHTWGETSYLAAGDSVRVTGFGSSGADGIGFLLGDSAQNINLSTAIPTAGIGDSTFLEQRLIELCDTTGYAEVGSVRLSELTSGRARECVMSAVCDSGAGADSLSVVHLEVSSAQGGRLGVDVIAGAGAVTVTPWPDSLVDGIGVLGPSMGWSWRHATTLTIRNRVGGAPDTTLAGCVGVEFLPKHMTRVARFSPGVILLGRSLGEIDLRVCSPVQSAVAVSDVIDGENDTWLGGACPNPATRGTMRFECRLPRAAVGEIEAVDVSGRIVGRSGWVQLAAGRGTITWDPGALRSGVYLVRLRTSAGVSAARRIVVLR